MTCAIEDCDRPVQGRGLCRRHYRHAERTGAITEYPRSDEPAWVNPLVCVCEVPDADPARNFGECAICRRKPLDLMAVAS